MGTVIAVASGKGGTGKTSFCANIAVSLCALGEKVLVIDADSGLRSLDLVLGMTDSLLFSYGDVIRGNASLKEAAVAHPIAKNLRVLTAPGEPGIGEVYAPKDIAALLKNVRAHFTYTLVDCAAGLGSDVLSFAAAARIALALALKAASRMWCAFLPASLRRCRQIFDSRTKATKNSSPSSVSKVPTLGRLICT